MNNFKNFLIAILAGLLVLTLSTQNSGATSTSTSAAAIQYDNCLKVDLTGIDPSRSGSSIMPYAISDCSKYKP